MTATDSTEGPSAGARDRVLARIDDGETVQLASDLMAALAIQRSGVAIRGDVVVACVAAELNGGIGTRHAVDAIVHMMRAIEALYAMRFTHTHDPDLPGLPRMNIGSIVGGRGRDHELRGPYTVSDFCTAYVNVRSNASQSAATVVADIRQTLATHLWAAGIPCCLYGPEDLSVCARVLALTALAAVA